MCCFLQGIVNVSDEMCNCVISILAADEVFTPKGIDESVGYSVTFGGSKSNIRLNVEVYGRKTLELHFLVCLHLCH